MLVSVTGILKEEGSSLDFQGEQLLGNIEFQGECVEFVAPLKIKGTISNTSQMLLAKISIEGCLRLQCGACIKMYEQKINFSFEASYKRLADPEDPDVFSYQNDRVDVKEAIMEHIFLNLPTRRRCKETCRGLCSSCGLDLNISQCNCHIL